MDQASSARHLLDPHCLANPARQNTVPVYGFGLVSGFTYEGYADGNGASAVSSSCVCRAARL